MWESLTWATKGSGQHAADIASTCESWEDLNI